MSNGFYRKNGIVVDDEEWSAVLTGKVLLDMLQDRFIEQNRRSRSQTQELTRQINSLIDDHLQQQQSETEKIRDEMNKVNQSIIGRFSELKTGENIALDVEHQRKRIRKNIEKRRLQEKENIPSPPSTDSEVV